MTEQVTISCVLLVPVALADAANQLSIALGYAQDPDTYTKPILRDGELSYCGAHTWASSVFVGLIDNAHNGIIPPELATQGYDAVQVKALVDAMIISIRNYGEPLDHWNAVLAANGLTEPVYEGEA